MVCPHTSGNGGRGDEVGVVELAVEAVVVAPGEREHNLDTSKTKRSLVCAVLATLVVGYADLSGSVSAT